MDRAHESPEPQARRPGASKRRLRILAGLAAAAAFALPWAVIRAVPYPPKPNAVVLPPGAVVVAGGGHAATSKGSTTPTQAGGHSVAVTRASGVPPP